MRQALAIILFIFVGLPCMFTFQVITGINSFIFDANFYTSFVDSPVLYEYLSNEMRDDGELIDKIPYDFIKDTVIAETSPEALRQTVTEIADDTIDAILNGRNVIPFTLDISSWHEPVVNGSSEVQEVTITALVGIAHVCGPREPSVIEGQLFPTCISSEANRERITNQILDRKEEIIANFPSQITYEIPLDLSDSEVDFVQIRQGLITAMIATGIISISMWLLTTLIYKPKTSSRLRWLGVTLFIPSILIMITSVLYSQAIVLIIAEVSAEAETAIDAEIMNTIGSGLLRTWITFFAIGLISALLGGVLFIYGSYKGKQEHQRKNKNADSWEHMSDDIFSTSNAEITSSNPFDESEFDFDR